MKQSVAIMDFGTSKITVMIGSRGINNSICLDGIGMCEYAGYSGGNWLDLEHLQSAILQAISCAEKSARVHADKLYIGVPNEFSMCRVNDVSISLNKKRKVTEQDIEILRETGNKFASDPDWSVINIQPIYYMLDDAHKLIDPVGMESTRLGGSISYMLAKTDFIEVVDLAVDSADIHETEYVSSSLAEMLFLFDDYTRDKCVMFADIGAIGTSLTIGRGDGIARQYYFPWGGARITTALSDKLGLSFAAAEKLKKKVILSLEPGFVPPEPEAPPVLQTEYEVEIDNELYSYPVTDVNNVVRLEIERLSRYITKALKSCDYYYPEYTPLSVTGGGLNHIRGAAEYLAEMLGREVNAVKPSLPMLDRPQFSSALGLLDMVLTSDTPDGGFFDKMLRKLTKRKR